MRGGSHGAPPSRGTPGRRGRSPRVSKTASPAPTTSEDVGLGSARPNATFTTCLSIPVQGATPIEPSEAPQDSRMNHGSAQPPAPPGRRAPRKSKLDALAALQNRDSSSSPEPDDDMNGGRDSFRAAAPMPVPTGLDMKVVKTRSPRHPPKTERSRPFGLQDCPTYYPSAEEFKDPMGYISTIYEEAARHGICKVVPPAEWSMPFVTDTEVSIAHVAVEHHSIDFYAELSV
jgi:histone demethylase JARID1